MILWNVCASNAQMLLLKWMCLWALCPFLYMTFLPIVVGVFLLMSNHRLSITEGGNWPTGVLTAECAHFPMLSGVKGHRSATATVVTTPRTQGLSCVAVRITGCMRLKQERQRGALCVFDFVCVCVNVTQQWLAESGAYSNMYVCVCVQSDW